MAVKASNGLNEVVIGREWKVLIGSPFEGYIRGGKGLKGFTRGGGGTVLGEVGTVYRGTWTVDWVTGRFTHSVPPVMLMVSRGIKNINSVLNNRWTQLYHGGSSGN